MSRKNKLIVFILSLCLSALCVSIRLPKPARIDDPTIVVIVFDSLRPDHLSCYGYPKKTSPAIDALAGDSVLFEKAFSVAPKTAPSMMSLFTGLSPLVHGVWNNQNDYYWRLSDNIPTLPQLLKKRGYFTAGFVQQGNLRPAIGFGRGFDVYQENPRYVQLGTWIGEVADVIKKSGREHKPLFLFVHTNCTHVPYAGVSRKVSTVFLDKKVAGLPGAGVDIGPMMTVDEFFSYFNFSRSGHRQHLIGLYDSAVYFGDRIFDALQKLLKDTGRYDNSIIIVMADHGEEFFEHKSVFHARLFVETLHVPLIIKFPFGSYAGTRVPGYTSLIDVTPTLLDFLRFRDRPRMQGVSFLPLLTQEGSYQSLAVSYSVDKEGVRFIKDGFVYSNNKDALGAEFLFDIRRDPFEKNNIAKKKPEITRKMRVIASAIVSEDRQVAGALRSKPQAIAHVDREAAVRELKALGYAQ